ncbi:hypothetical protein HX747_15295 [Streptomyces sp. L06]|nr:hypothetical protein [Streptomyces sp. L06]
MTDLPELLAQTASALAVLSEHARSNCSKTMQSVRSGMNTDLLMISDPLVRDRYRTLVALLYDIGWRGAGRAHRERHIGDARHYALERSGRRKLSRRSLRHDDRPGLR